MGQLRRRFTRENILAFRPPGFPLKLNISFTSAFLLSGTTYELA
jgi:hypothetical protein